MGTTNGEDNTQWGDKWQGTTTMTRTARPWTTATMTGDGSTAQQQQ